MGSNASQGLGTLAMYFPNIVFRRNVIAAAPAYMYPTDNFYPASLADVGFVDLAGRNYQLGATSPYRTSATDGTEVGVRFNILTGALGGTTGP